MEGWTTASLGLHFLDEPSKAFAHRVGTTINRDSRKRISTTHGWPSSSECGRLSSAAPLLVPVRSGQGTTQHYI
jgi:hypothetical protein